jgi:hypothetical protein
VVGIAGLSLKLSQPLLSFTKLSAVLWELVELVRGREFRGEKF